MWTARRVLLRSKLKLFGVVLLALLTVVQSTAGVITQSGSKLFLPPANVVFFDDFPNSSVDSSKWEVYDRDGDRVNSELNVVRPANAQVSGGILSILAQYSLNAYSGYDAADNTSITRSYATAQIATKQTFLYGTFEARIKAASAAGTWPLFWMLGYGWQASQPTTANVAGHNWPAVTGGWWEIDIMEFGNGTRTANNTAAHVNSSNVQEVALSYNASSRYIVYRLEWQPTYLRWSVDYEDGTGFHELRTLTDTNHIPTNAGYLICHTAIGGFGGTPNSADYPDSSLYDWVKVTQ
jgi:beta-glucanase (GH16 family)